MYKIIFSTLLVVSSFNAQAENRFSMSIEYAIMDRCVGNTRYRDKKIELCECALAKTIKGSGWIAKYKTDKSYLNDKEEFKKRFKKSTKECKNR
ncbi:MAG: hypothetical protein FE834_03820 [Gammaproteobacteria bacterium]|nr:hypothetical protein [Gammaproteobacteria bacterium]